MTVISYIHVSLIKTLISLHLFLIFHHGNMHRHAVLVSCYLILLSNILITIMSAFPLNVFFPLSSWKAQKAIILLRIFEIFHKTAKGIFRDVFRDQFTLCIYLQFWDPYTINLKILCRITCWWNFHLKKPKKLTPYHFTCCT